MVASELCSGTRDQREKRALDQLCRAYLALDDFSYPSSSTWIETRNLCVVPGGLLKNEFCQALSRRSDRTGGVAYWKPLWWRKTYLTLSAGTRLLLSSGKTTIQKAGRIPCQSVVSAHVMAPHNPASAVRATTPSASFHPDSCMPHAMPSKATGTQTTVTALRPEDDK